MANSLGDMVVRIVGDMTDFNKSIDATQKKFESATSNFTKLGKNLSTFVTLPILAIGTAAIKSAADMEMMEAQFTTMLGSGEKAKGLLKDLANLAANTPFQLNDLAAATKTMLSFGIAQDKILPNLKMLGDIAGGDSEKLKSLSLVFSQITSTGRLMGQDLLQLINTGFNPLQVIAKKTGESMAELKKRMEAGGISADEVTKAFESATSAGGLFFGGMERASQTFQGLTSTLLDDVTALGRSIGETLLPTMKELVINVDKWVKLFTDLDEETKQNIVRFGLLAASIGPLILVILETKKAVDATRLAFTLMTANPILLGLTAVALGIGIIAQGLKQAKIDSKNLSDSLSGLASLEAMRSSLKIQQQQLAVAVANKDAAIARIGKKAVEDGIAQQTALVNQLIKNIGYKELEIRETERLAAAEAKAAADTLDALKAKFDGVVQLTDKQKQELAEAEEKANQARMDETDALYDFYADAALANLAVQNAAYDADVAATIAANEKKKASYNEFFTSVNTIGKSVFDQLGKDIIAGEVSWENLATAAVNAIGNIISALGDQMAAKAAAAAIDAIVLAVLGAGTLAAQSAGAAAAYSLAAGVAWTTGSMLQAKKFADGGVVMPQNGGVQAIVAEAGQAEAIIPLDRLDQMLSTASSNSTDGGMTSLVVNLDSKPLLDKIFNATKNRTVLISQGAVV